MTRDEKLQAIKAVEVPFLADLLAQSIANLGYPVGLGVPPSEDHTTKAAEAIFQRFAGIAEAVRDAEIEQLRAKLADYEEAHEDQKRLVQHLDIVWNGKEGAAKQASLCDIVSQICREWPAIKGQKPVAWPNRCDHTIVAALQYLSRFQRPEGGNDLFNAEHLEQLADELQRMANRPLYALPVADKDAEDAARYRWLRGLVYIDPEQKILRIADIYLLGQDVPKSLDAAIDAAMAKGEKK